MEKDVDLNDLRDPRRFRQVLEDIDNGTDHYIVKDHGHPKAALMPLADLRLLKYAKADKDKAWENIFKILDSNHARNPDVSEEEVHALVAEAIQATREQHS